MKTLIIATDFSSCSQHASRYGVELANVMDMKIILMNVYNVPLSIPESYVIVKPEEVKKTAEEYLQEEVVALKKKSSKPIEFAAVEGPVTDTILDFADNYDDAMILVGMRGESGALRKTFGSTASSLARKTNKPLLIIPESAEFSTLYRIALATDEARLIRMHVVNSLKSMGEHFGSRIHVVKVLKTNAGIVEELTSRSDAFISLLKPLDVEFNFPRARNVALALDEFTNENKIDLLAVIPHHHTFLERVFVRSETRELIFHSRIPLLVIPESIKPAIKKSEQLQHHVS